MLLMVVFLGGQWVYKLLSNRIVKMQYNLVNVILMKNHAICQDEEDSEEENSNNNIKIDKNKEE